MNGNEFLKRLKRYAKRYGMETRFVPYRGKGSHGTAYLGDRFTMVKDRKKDLSPDLYHEMLRQLGINHRDF